MQVRVKLMAALRSKLPPRSQEGLALLELQPGATVATALEQLGLSSGHVHLVLLNGEMATDRTTPLQDADELTVFPPVAGG